MPVLAYVLTLVMENDGIAAPRWRPVLVAGVSSGIRCNVSRLWMANECQGLDSDPLSPSQDGACLR